MDLRDWVWKSGCPLSLSQAAVWAALAALRRRDQPEQLVYPSLEEIAAAAKVSKRTVIRTLKDLQQLGLVVIHRKTKKGSARDEVNRYRVAVPAEQPADLAEKVAKLKKGDQVSMSTAVEPRQMVGYSPDQVPQRPRLGATDPPDQVPISTSKPCHESLPIETITPELAPLASGTRDPFGINDDSTSEVVSPPSADDAAAPRADDDEGGSAREVGARSEVLELRDVGEPSERQLEMLRDLYLLAYGVAPDWRFFNNARRLDQDGVTRYRRELYGAIPHGRGHAYDGPEPGDGVYELLSQHGRAWADVGLDPSEAPFIRHDLAERLGEGGR